MKKLILGFLFLTLASFAATSGTTPVTANRIIRGSGAPSAGTCNTAAAVGKVYIRLDAAATFHTFYVCSNTASMMYAWELGGGGSGSGCVPSGSNTDILLDNGSGGCSSSSATIDGSGNGTFNSITTSGSSAGMLSLTNNATPGTPVADSWGWTVGSTITTAWYGQAPNASPSANNVMLFGAPSSNVSTWTWTAISGTGSFCMTLGCSVIVTTNHGTSRTVASNSEIYVCTSTCTVTPLTPSEGTQLCVQNDDNVSTVITLAAIASVQYETQARTSYGTANHTVTSGGAIKDQICIVGRDATHYDIWSATGTFINN